LPLAPPKRTANEPPLSSYIDQKPPFGDCAGAFVASRRRPANDHLLGQLLAAAQWEQIEARNSGQQTLLGGPQLVLFVSPLRFAQILLLLARNLSNFIQLCAILSNFIQLFATIQMEPRIWERFGRKYFFPNIPKWNLWKSN